MCYVVVDQSKAGVCGMNQSTAVVWNGPIRGWTVCGMNLSQAGVCRMSQSEAVVWNGLIRGWTVCGMNQSEAEVCVE